MEDDLGYEDYVVLNSPQPCACICGCDLEALPEEVDNAGLCPLCAAGQHRGSQNASAD